MELKGNLQKEYNDPYTNKKTFEEYYKGKFIQEFIELPEIVYNEWKYWKNEYNRRIFEPVEKYTFDKYFQDFKDYWQYGTPETEKVFEEMKLLSDTMANEWRINYTFTSCNTYESYDSCTKEELWEEFKSIWGLNTDDYNDELIYAGKLMQLTGSNDKISARELLRIHHIKL